MNKREGIFYLFLAAATCVSLGLFLSIVMGVRLFPLSESEACKAAVQKEYRRCDVLSERALAAGEAGRAGQWADLTREALSCFDERNKALSKCES